MGKIQDIIINQTSKKVNRELINYIPKPKPVNDKDSQQIGKYELSDVSKQLRNIFNILECNKKTNKRHLSLHYFVDGSKHNYKQYYNYSCNNSNCAKCKARKMYEYVNDRFLYSDKVYFITISSIIEYDNLNEKDISDFRKLISNGFDFLKYPYIATFEIGEKGLKMHSHIVLFNAKEKAIYITDFLKLYTGLIVNGAILSNDDNKLKNYMSKVNKYISKINKDDTYTSKENFIDINKNIYGLFQNIQKKDYKKLLDKIDLLDIDKMRNFNQYMEIIEKSFSISKIDNNKKAMYQLISFVWSSNKYKYDRVVNLLKEKYYNNDLDKYFKKLSKFNQKQLKIILKYLNYYMELIAYFNKNIDSHNPILWDTSLIRINSNIFLTSVFNKRISSNISIRKKINTVTVKEKKESLLTTKEYKIELEFNMIKDNQDLTKDFNLENVFYDLESEKDILIQYAIKNRTVRIESLIYNKMIKNSIDNKNEIIHLLTSQQKNILANAITHFSINKANKYKNIYIKNYCKKFNLIKKNLSDKEINEIILLQSKIIKKDLIKKYEKLYTNKKTIINKLPF